MIRYNISLFVCLFIFCGIYYRTKAKNHESNYRPVIGVVAQMPVSIYTPKGNITDTYIVASYVKLMEMAGAHVIPIFPSYGDKKIIKLTESVNGMVFPGGSAKMFPLDSGYSKVTKLVYERAKKLNDNGIHFPIFGICLGIQALYTCEANHVEGVVTRGFDAENYSVPLNMTKYALKSRLFNGLSKHHIETLMYEPMAMNMHINGISPKLHEKYKFIDEMYKIISTNYGRGGNEFVSSMEGTKYPFYGIQWHPEKLIFEWIQSKWKKRIKHWQYALEICQEMANFFINEARKNNQHFKSDKEVREYSIFQYTPINAAEVGLFSEVYEFKNTNERYMDYKPQTAGGVLSNKTDEDNRIKD